jgi:glycosyltransferase involved in cell wall biosynthesis
MSTTDGVPLLVFADDWGRHPSSCQHLVRNLLPRHETCWVNTVGTRKPRLDLATVTRGLEKLRHWTKPRPAAEPLPEHLHVRNPLMWPAFDSRPARRLNRFLLGRQLRKALRVLPASPVAVTTLPLVADLIDELPVRGWVYYCVDDFSLWPGLDQQTLGRMEEALVRRADVLIAVSETLQEKLGRMGREAHLLTHGIEPAHWQVTGDPRPLTVLEGFERPLVVFWGLKDRRMDVAFVHQLAADLERGTIVFAGPESDPDPALYQSRRVVALPPLDYDDLPHLAAHAAVLVMPYADLPVTRAIQPLKLKEYLATGRPVVVRDLPATRAWADSLDLADSPASFSAAVRRRLAEGLPPSQAQARWRLADESWEEKARRFEALLPRQAQAAHCA